MFANLLLDEEKKSFLKLLAYLSKVDGDLSQEEIGFIDKVAVDLNIKSTGVFDDIDKIDLNIICNDFKNNLSKNVVILELINLAFADKEYKTSEREGIKVISKILSISDDRLKEMEQWINEGIAWAERGSKIVNS